MGSYDTLPSMLPGHMPTGTEWSQILALLNGSGANGGLLDEQAVFRTTDDTFSATTTMANDAVLFVPVVASATYEYELFLAYAGAATPQIKIGWAVPASATNRWCVCGLDATITANSSGIIDMALRSGSTPTLGVAGASTKVVAKIKGTLVTSSTAGNLQFQRAQAVSNVTASTVGAGSALRLKRLI